LIKDDVKVKVPNKTPKILIIFYGVVNWDRVVKWDGVLKFGGRAEGDHATHFLGWIKKHIAWSLV
jgi:hypothetical protein